MKRVRLKIAGLLVIAAIVAILGTGCSEDGCYESTESLAGMTIYDNENGNSVATDSITVYGAGPVSDTLYLNKSLKILYLPSDPASQSVSFVIVNGLVHDTVTLHYSSRHNFVSKACGYNFIYSLSSISHTTHRLDTILLINENVTPADEENIRAFY